MSTNPHGQTEDPPWLPPDDVEFWFVDICPECRQQQDHGSWTHTGGCPNMGKVFAVLTIPVVPHGEYVCRQQEIRALLEPVRKLVEGRINPRPTAGQWTTWLTAAEHEEYRHLLEALDDA